MNKGKASKTGFNKLVGLRNLGKEKTTGEIDKDQKLELIR